MSCAEVAPSGVNEAMTSVVNDLTREVVKELTRLHIPPRWTRGTDYGYSPLNCGKQAIRIAHQQFSQTPARIPGNRGAF